jgi:hypothetical protein
MRRSTAREVFSSLLFYHMPSSLLRVCTREQRTDEARGEKERSMDASAQVKRSGLGKNRQKRTPGESSDVPERKVQRLNERGRKSMKRNLNGWGSGRTNIAGEPFFPGEPPMRTRCTGFERRGLLLRVNKCFRRPNGDQHGLRSQELDKGPSDLAARPIAPAHWLNWNRRRGWSFFNGRNRLLRLGD